MQGGRGGQGQREETETHDICETRARSGRFRESFRCAFHMVRSVQCSPATSSVHNPRCWHRYSPYALAHRHSRGVSRRSRAPSSQQASKARCVKQEMTLLPFVAASRRPGTCAPCQQYPGLRRYQIYTISLRKDEFCLKPVRKRVKGGVGAERRVSRGPAGPRWRWKLANRRPLHDV